MLNPILSPHVMKALGKPIDQLDRTIRRPKKQRPGIRSHRSAIECRHHFASFNGCKSEQICATLCLHRGAPRIDGKRCGTTTFADSALRCTVLCEKCGLVALPKHSDGSAAILRVVRQAL